MSTWTIRPVQPQDHPRLVEVLNLTDPTEPTTLERFRENDARRDKSHPFVRLAAEGPDATLAGYGLVGTFAWQPPGVHVLRIVVDPAMGGRGAGGALYRALEEQAREWGATRLDCDVRDSHAAARAFMQRRGFALAHHMYESELDLTGFDPAPFRPYVPAAEARGYRFHSLAELPGEENRRRLYELHMEVARDAPANSEEDWQQASFETYAKEMFDSPSFDPRGDWVAIQDGEWAGISGLAFPPDQDRAWTWFTGVRRQHRGRGVAQALKVLAIEYAIQKGYRRVGTGNHSENPGMLAINRKLGFVRRPGIWTMRKRLTGGGPS